MGRLEILRYNVAQKKKWDEFILKAKNSSFLFYRNFMDYHQDRFQDFSLFVLEKNEIVAVLPAHLSNNVLYSHKGLSYGGIICLPEVSLTTYENILKAIFLYCNKQNILEIEINSIPSIYSSNFSEELAFFNFAFAQKTARVQLLSSIDFRIPFHMNENRKRMINKGIKNKFYIKEEKNANLFWQTILVPRLQSKYDNIPVHTMEEMNYLMQSFPQNIKQFNVFNVDGKIMAGTTIFENKNVVHLQYIAGLDEGNREGALDFLIYNLLEKYKNKVDFFDFGSSNITDKTLNKGLIYWKESFGARSVAQYTYVFSTKEMTSIF